MDAPVVVGVDGSEASLAAVEWAAEEAVRHGLPLRIVHASLWERYEGVDADVDEERPSGPALAEDVVAAAAERARLRAPDLPVATDVLPEDPSGALLREGREATLLVVGSRGRGTLADLLLGSVSLGVAARSHCPVVVVRGDRHALEGLHGRVLLGVGEHDADSPAVRFAFREAAARSAELDAVRVWRRPHPGGGAGQRGERQASAELAEALSAPAREHPGVRLRTSTLEGHAHKELTGRSAAADLLVVGARRRDGAVGLELGRVAHRALHHAVCPVAVVPVRPEAERGL
ncbi:universal stress protein [Streptomyces sp. NPDC058740]|uniref:universal stress protein n=1 Tax=unclassified Streptomyces TaxID=2593676 RepID=UPI0036B8FA08